LLKKKIPPPPPATKNEDFRILFSSAKIEEWALDKMWETNQNAMIGMILQPPHLSENTPWCLLALN
jgi:hypothetical protein